MSNDTVFGFTKIIVDDLDRSAAFYCQALGFRELQRVQARVAGERIEEIILVHGKKFGEGVPLIVWKWMERPAPVASDSILGFQTGDVDGLLARVVAAGGSLVEFAQDQPRHGVRVAFAKDPDGRLLELVQMLAS